MAMLLKPSLLICDEPTTALDVTTQKEILTLIDELQQEQGSAVLFITHDVEEALVLAERLRLAMQQQPPRLPDGSLLNLSASFGLAARPPGLRASLPDLFGRADAALYAAKAQGRNQVQLAN